MKVGNNFIKNFKFHRRKLFLKLIFPFLIFIHSFDSYMSTITLKKKKTSKLKKEIRFFTIHFPLLDKESLQHTSLSDKLK